MAFSHIITNAVAVLTEAGFVENDPRHTLEAECDAGKDLRFTVEATPVAETLARHAISDNVRTAVMKVRFGFFAGGGDSGGAGHGGDMRHVNARAYDMCKAAASLLENQIRYDQATGIRRRINPRWDEESVARRSVVWALLMDVEWEQVEDPRAVAA